MGGGQLSCNSPRVKKFGISFEALAILLIGHQIALRRRGFGRGIFPSFNRFMTTKSDAAFLALSRKARSLLMLGSADEYHSAENSRSSQNGFSTLDTILWLCESQFPTPAIAAR
jgi:hypothetical protein